MPPSVHPATALGERRQREDDSSGGAADVVNDDAAARTREGLDALKRPTRSERREVADLVHSHKQRAQQLRQHEATAPSVDAPPTTTTEPPPEQEKSTSVRSTYRLDWAALLKGVVAGARRVPLWVDVLECSRCRGPMRVIACIEEQAVAKKILLHLGLPAEPLPTARAQASPVTIELFPAA